MENCKGQEMQTRIEVLRTWMKHSTLTAVRCLIVAPKCITTPTWMFISHKP